MVARMPAIPPGMAACCQWYSSRRLRSRRRRNTWRSLDALEREVAVAGDGASAAVAPDLSTRRHAPGRADAVEAARQLCGGATAVLVPRVLVARAYAASAELPTQATYGAHAAKDLAASATPPCTA